MLIEVDVYDAGDPLEILGLFAQESPVAVRLTCAPHAATERRSIAGAGYLDRREVFNPRRAGQ